VAPPRRTARPAAPGRAGRWRPANSPGDGGPATGGQAAHRPARHHAHPAQPLGRVLAPGARAKLLPAVAVPVEDHRVQVNPPAAAVGQDQPRRQAGHRPRIVPEPRLGQRCSCQIAAVAGDDQVQVLVDRLWRPSSASTPQPPSSHTTSPAWSSRSRIPSTSAASSIGAVNRHSRPTTTDIGRVCGHPPTTRPGWRGPPRPGFHNSLPKVKVVG
jgi:hypothetical protein